jgi:UDPglucose 6-dehydrogenase
MNVAIVGTGYVGLVTGVCLAERGNKVYCVDNNPKVVERLSSGEITIYEPGLEEIFSSSRGIWKLRCSDPRPSSCACRRLPTRTAPRT